MQSTKLFLYLLFLSVFGQLSAQDRQTDQDLQAGLEELVKDFKGTVGIYVYHPLSNKEAGVNADTIFPTASVIKVPILAGLFKKIEAGDYTLHQEMIYNDDRVYGGSGLMQFYKDSTTTDLRTLAALMITYSDNVTSIWSQELSGGGVEINKYMDELGLENTKVNSRTQGREDIWEVYGWGQTTPREMSELLLKIRNREVVSPRASDEMYRMMTNSFYTDYSLSQIPPYVQTAAKQGMVNRSRSELVMVNAPSGDYVFYFTSKNNEDTSWDHDNEAWELSRKVSAYLWKYFEPNSDWEPAKGSVELVKGLPY